MNSPRATMRLQFHKGFTFADAGALVPYFASLGISHLYASPIMKARAGSLHGYDVIDPAQVNPELGGEEGLRQLVHALRRHAMGLIVDIVPNHMAASNDNQWWFDVLAHGRASRYAKFFDIDWAPARPDLRDKVLLPILGRPYGEALDAGEIALLGPSEREPPFFRYFEHRLPIAGADLGGLPSEAFDPHRESGREQLHLLLERQHYRLAWWRSANDDINWRRFFDVNDLAALRVEDEEVFERVHSSLFRLYAEGLVDGIRVDHIDGLLQPEAYCKAIRRRLRALKPERPNGVPDGEAYFVVEKILGRGECLPRSWETDGTTGYDFMDEVSALLHDPAGEAELSNLWHRFSGRCGDFPPEEELARRQILERSFSAQFEASVAALYEIAQGDLATRDLSRAGIARALKEILGHFPVYRLYARVGDASKADLAFLARAVEGATAACLPSDRWMVEMLGHWLSGERIRPQADQLQAQALARFQQLSAPLCAKAVEDTASYRYGRLLSRTDVGFDPSLFAFSPSEFHRKMHARSKDHPHSMLATATHDHKRGEDMRARLAVLSELANEWTMALDRWVQLAAPLRRVRDGTLVPSGGDLAILFQTIVGAWPPGLAIDDQPGLAEFSDRLARWQQKALREAKLASDWLSPDEKYERATLDFIATLLGEKSELLTDIAQFVRRIAAAGAANSLGQLMVKLTAPGMPDFYQGTEYWDFSLVDPDNRRLVDFAARQRSLATALSGPLPSDWTDGRIKQAVMARLLAARRIMPRLFSDGTYLPIKVKGPLADHVVAFARVLGGSAALAIISRRVTRLLADDGCLTVPESLWGDTSLVLPMDLQVMAFADKVSGAGQLQKGAVLPVRHILNAAPVAFLTNDSA